MCHVCTQVLKQAIKSLSREELVAYAIAGALSMDKLATMTNGEDLSFNASLFTDEEVTEIQDSCVKVHKYICRMTLHLN